MEGKYCTLIWITFRNIDTLSEFSCVSLQLMYTIRVDLETFELRFQPEAPF